MEGSLGLVGLRQDIIIKQVKDIIPYMKPLKF